MHITKSWENEIEQQEKEEKKKHTKLSIKKILVALKTRRKKLDIEKKVYLLEC